jgi:hypothetical protein
MIDHFKNQNKMNRFIQFEAKNDLKVKPRFYELMSTQKRVKPKNEVNSTPSKDYILFS